MCNQGGTVSPFLSSLACQILSLTDKHGITLAPAYIPIHLSVEADYLSWDWLLPEWHLLPQVAHAGFCLWGLLEVDLLASSHSTQCHLGNSTTSRGLGVECLQPSLDFSGKLSVSSFSSSSSSSVQVSGRTCQWSTQIFDSGGTMLDGGSWLPTILNMLADVPQWCPIIKDLIMDVLVGQALKGLQYLHLTL